MSSKMIEKVARAIWHADFPESTPFPTAKEGDWGNSTRGDLFRQAKAAIEALMEPTDAMVEASACECGTNSPEENVRKEYVRYDFKRMMAAALGEQP